MKMKEHKKILLLGDVNSIHLQKWMIALKEYFEVGVFSIDALNPKYDWLNDVPNVHLFTPETSSSNSRFIFGYLKHMSRLKKVIHSFKPDITHAHYATSYGLLGTLVKPRNYCISLWGTDTYLFPKKSFLHRQIFKLILSAAKQIFATSKDLAKAGKLYTPNKITVIPFGVDTEKFSPNKVQLDTFTFGTVKGLDLIYGIDRFIDAFAIFNRSYPNSQCLIYGKGPHEMQFIEQINRLSLSDKVKLMGFIEHDKVPSTLNTFDVYCALSRSESFGVAIIEASACEIPVIVSNIGGLTEVVEHEKTGFIVKGDDLSEIVQRMEILYHNADLRKKFGESGRLLVQNDFEWKQNVASQVTFYNKMLN